MKITNIKKIDILCYFVFSGGLVENERNNAYPNSVKFVFSKEDIDYLDFLVRNKKSEFYPFYLPNESIDNVINILNNNLYEYNNKRDDQIYYIYVDDIIKFTDLLYELYISVKKEVEDDSTYTYKYLDAVWLRMSPNDYSDIFKFLRKQIEFSKSNYFKPNNCFSIDYYKPKYLCDFLDYEVKYNIITTSPWYETNRKIEFFIERNEENKLYLPDVYFSVIDEDNKKVCYLYAIQNPKGNIYNDEIVENSLTNIKRVYRNKYVNYKFLLSLKYFIKLMEENGIYDIKVPLLQLFNYDYHISMSEEYKRNLDSLNKKIEEGKISEYAQVYIQVKAVYDKVADKEDIISKNKTERLVHTFYVLNEIYNNIDILNDPFIEDENLIVKIKKITRN